MESNETPSDEQVSVPGSGSNTQHEQNSWAPGSEARLSGRASRPVEPVLLRRDTMERLEAVIDLTKSTSLHTDPEAMVRDYGARVRTLFGAIGIVSLSRRGLTRPWFRITRASAWKEAINPWRHQDRLPVFDRGLFSRLIHEERPVILRDLRVEPDDPAAPYLRGVRSLTAVPHFDRGQGLNMACMLFGHPDGVPDERFPELVWLSNLFGRATNSLLLANTLRETSEALDREMQAVAKMQLALLPRELPKVEGVRFAAHYQTSRNAGGDWYDFFELPDGRLGILVADVSGHGTPAAVLMAILHAIAHQSPDRVESPSAMLTHLNQQFCRRYTWEGGIEAMFCTAFYAVYDPRDRSLTYASAGHPPPRLRVGFTGPGGAVLALDQAQGIPLGIFDEAEYPQARVTLDPGDAVVFYTDGLTEAWGPGEGAPGEPRRREMFGIERLDAVVGRSHDSAGALLAAILSTLEAFTQGVPAADDLTILVLAAE